MATTKWYTISELSGFNSQNGYVGETSWFWGRYSKGACSGYIGVGNVNGSSRSAVLVFWLPFPSSLISSNITIDKIEVQMNQTVSSGISSGKNYATYACTTAVQPDTPKAWNGTGQTNNPKIFATDNTVTTRTAGTTWNPTYTYKVTNRSNLPAGTKGCYIQFSGGNYQVQSMSEFTMGPNTYPKFRFTYTDSSTPSVSNKTISFFPIYPLTSGSSPGRVTASSNKSTFTFPTASSLGWTRSGYTLANWNTTQSSTGTNYSPGSTYAIAYSDLQSSYYARWQQNAPSTVTFTFNPGNYSDGSKSSYTRSYSYSSSSNVSLPSGSDYFTGTIDSGSKQYYYLTCNCGAGSFSNGVSVANASSDWTRLQTQYVQNGWSLNNGVTSGTRYTNYTPDSNTTFYPYWGDQESSWQYDITLSIPNEKPTRSGYSFVEWNTNSSGTGTSYQPGGSIRQPASNGYFSNIALYAIWETGEFKITFSPGNYGSGSSRELTTTNGKLTTLPANYFTRSAGTTYYSNYYLQGGTMSTPSGFSVNTSATYGPRYQTSNKTTYYHNYWNNDPNGTPQSGEGVNYWNCNKTYTFTSNLTLYPEWNSSIPQYILPTPTKVGYKFVTWNTNASGTGTNYAAGTKYELTSNKTFYAIWEPEWTIKINNGTSWGDYHVWIYTGTSSNNGWRQAIPYVYDGSNWKLTKI